jgi:hypothetical protein
MPNTDFPDYTAVATELARLKCVCVYIYIYIYKKTGEEKYEHLP